MPVRRIMGSPFSVPSTMVEGENALLGYRMLGGNESPQTDQRERRRLSLTLCHQSVMAMP